MAVAREAEPSGSLREAQDAGLDRADLLGIYRAMLVTRGIEERGHILYKQGKVPGSFYTGRGNEGSAVGAAWAMAPDDVGAPLHRHVGVHVVRGIEPWRIFAQFMGRVDGPTHGRDGNIHFGDLRYGTIGLASHLPATMPVAVGCALAFAIEGRPRVAVAWYGDGSAQRGDVHESMNLAGVRKLPVVFVCDNNQFAYSTPNRLEFACEHLADRAPGYGFDGVVVDGTDVLAVHREVKAAIERARAGGGPTLVESVTLRLEGHAVHDDAYYVPRELLERYAQNDPVERYRRWLQREIGLSDSEEHELAADVRRTLAEALRRAEESPLPDPATVADGVWAAPDALDAPHHR